MKLKFLKFKNLFSYENAEIDLNKLNLALFKGENGTGKSSIFDILCWILYGTTARKKYKTILRNSPDKPRSGYGSIVFTISDGTDYKVERGVGVKKFFKLYKNGELQKFRTPTMIQDEIVKIIGADYKTFLNIAYFSQGDVGKFLSAESGERIKIVTDMIGELGDIDVLKKSIDSDAKKISYETENLKGQLLAHKEIVSGIDVNKIKKEIKIKESAANKYIEDLVEISQIISAMDEKKNFQEKLKNLEIEYEEYIEDIGFENAKILSDLKNLENKKNSEPELVKKYDDIVVEINKIGDVKIHNQLNEKEINEFEDKNVELKTLIELNQKEINALEKVMKLKNSICPTCKSIIDDDNIYNLSNICTAKNNENNLYKESIENNIKLLKKLYNVRKSIQDKIGKINQLTVQKTELKNKINALKDLEDEIIRLKQYYQDKKEKYSNKIKLFKQKIKQVKNDLRYLKDVDITQYNSIKEKYNRYDLLLNQVQDELRKQQIIVENYYNSVKKITQIQNELDKFFENEKIISFWSVALPKIKIDMISNIIPFLESESNKYLSQILPGKMIKFIADSDKVNNKMDIMIYDIENNVDRIYEGWSGGEKSKMSISVYLALNKLASLRSGKSIDFLILDEKFSAIDSKSRMMVVEMLKSEYRDRKIWAISHVENLDSEFSQIVETVKVDGISRVVLDD